MYYMPVVRVRNGLRRVRACNRCMHRCVGAAYVLGYPMPAHVEGDDLRFVHSLLQSHINSQMLAPSPYALVNLPLNLSTNTNRGMGLSVNIHRNAKSSTRIE